VSAVIQTVLSRAQLFQSSALSREEAEYSKEV
jgi:hypothetical protein